ncbi:hypothetical protein GCM10011390_49670 [Aureimonas endophytica]|uniref:PIN domain-containing protein n=1 Tax=Aureimonas endophytica TaxID=2027858 RepID=A0A917EE38_9HYPH|nr:type II toxin-antitoxin system VapC family toxin [Aureimonas endophytica]GGE24322.1 hypothetical protein GCM10011390_49670 [Aureimonas endophytica]
MAIRYALDASALLCLLQAEHGHKQVDAALDASVISSVNFSEVVAKLRDLGASAEMVQAMLDPLHLAIVDFTSAQARIAGNLRPATKSKGLSFGDLACLATAIDLECAVLTANRPWQDLDIGVEIALVR